MELLDEVQDPSDFPIDAFRKVDSSLRCPICKEFFDGPVILQCGHTFCSLCVRNVLPKKPECPKCCAPAKEIHLVRNTMLEEAVFAWSDARALTLQLSRQSIRPCASLPTGEPLKGTKRKHFQQVSDSEAGPSKLFRRGSSDDRAPLNEREGQELEEDEDNYEAGSDSAVTCPICNCDVLDQFINQHIDSACKKFLSGDVKNSVARREGDSKSKAEWDTIFNGQGKKSRNSSRDSQMHLKKLAKVSYGTLKHSQLRELLKDQGLSTVGERQELILRHERWVAINNANLDRKHPKSVSELRRQLKELEEVTSRPGPKKVQDEKAYTRKNRAQFATLVEAARPKAGDAKEPASVAYSVPPPARGSDPVMTTRTSSPSSVSTHDVILID